MSRTLAYIAIAVVSVASCVESSAAIERTNEERQGDVLPYQGEAPTNCLLTSVPSPPPSMCCHQATYQEGSPCVVE